MSTIENAINPTSTELVGFQFVAVDATEKGPSLPDPAVHGLVVAGNKLKELLTAVGANEKVIGEFESAVAGRGKDGASGPAFLVLTLFPIPRGNEVDTRKARKVYGAGKGIDLPFADPENNRLQISSLMFAPIKKEEDAGTSGDTEKDVE